MTDHRSALQERSLRFLKECEHLARPFGADQFGRKAEGFARFFGTPTFLVAQTLVVGTWIALNALRVVHFDIYPFILLNLMFSLQAAYAAPLILLAQTRQADRDKAHAEADALHREAVARDGLHRQEIAENSLALLRQLLDENTQMTRRIDELTMQIHGKVGDRLSTRENGGRAPARPPLVISAKADQRVQGLLLRLF